MCYSGKCIHCIPVEHGSLALGLLSGIGTALMLLWSTVYGSIITVDISSSKPLDHTSHSHAENNDNSIGMFFGDLLAGLVMWATEMFMILVAVASVIAFVFSVLLCVGVRDRRPGHVLAYFIYGVVVTVLSTSASVIQACDDSYNSPLPGIVGLCVCAVYLLCLVMVYKTYVKFQKEENHSPLLENCKIGLTA